ncbi:MAG: gliding motility-associated C-terminal domain-containing protein [Bacteroidia bacterium]
MRQKLFLFLFFITIVSQTFTQTLTFTVTNTLDDGSSGSLRWALFSASIAVADSVIIDFNIPGAGPHIIMMTSSLALSSDYVTLDATTQPNYELGMIKLHMAELFSNFTISGNFCKVYGLHLTSATSDPTWPTLSLTGSNNRIGAPGKGNIMAEGARGIYLDGASNAIQGNYIGAEPFPDGTYLNRGNSDAGIFIASTAGYNLIGGSKAGEGNVIAYNQTGIEFEAFAPVSIFGNQFFCNTGEGILKGNPTSAFPAPTITEARLSAVTGTGEAGSTVEIFSADELPFQNACFQNLCQGGIPLGTAVVGADNTWRLSDGNFLAGMQVVAIATAATGESSAFSACASVQCANEDLVVTSLSETGPGSFLSILSCAKTLEGPRTISFNLPGPPPWEIPVSTLTSININNPYLRIDATTQPGYVPGSVIIDGLGLSEGITIIGDTLEVYGLHFRNFTFAAFAIGGVGNIVGAPGKGNMFTGSLSGFLLAEGSSDVLIQGNYFGTVPDTTGDFFDLGNSSYGIYVFESDQIKFGGNNPAEQNIIAFNDTGIYVDKFSSQIQFAGNRMFCQANGAIVFENENTNLGKIPPIILSATVDTVSGTGNPGDTIDVYAADSRGCANNTNTCEGKYLLGKTVVQGDETWKLSGNYALSGLNVTAIATDVLGNSSVFAPCVEVPVVEEIISVIRAPTAFTPDGDGMNEAFIIQNIENFPNNELIILNRWGNQVYYSRSYNNDWTGTTSGGQPLLEGTYFYVLRITINGVRQTTRGAITIVR